MDATIAGGGDSVEGGTAAHVTAVGHRYAALLRGINVGRAKRVAMADLRDVVESLGHRDVRTLLNSGNVVFSGRRATPARLGQAIRTALRNRTGVDAAVTVVPASTLTSIVAGSPFLRSDVDPARLLVCFVPDRALLARLRSLDRDDWGPDSLVVGADAAYLACPDGILESPLREAAARALGDEGTTRNWATVVKLHDALQSA